MKSEPVNIKDKYKKDYMVEAQPGTANLDPSSWPSYGIPDLIAQVEQAHSEGKYCFIWDKTDQIDTFFKYKGFLCDFYFAVMKVEHQRSSVEDAIEKLRSDFIKSGRQGQHLMVNLAEYAPDFINIYSDPNLLDVNTAFNRTEWLKKEVHTSKLKEGENYSANAMSAGLYYLQPEWTMTIRSTAANAAAVQEVLSKIPHINDFRCIIME